MLVVEALLGAVGSAGVGPVLEQLTPMAENSSDREQQCAAAEVVAGLVRAGMEWPAEEAAGLWGKLGGVVEKALGSAPPDSVGVWAEALRFVASNRDPRRLLWISKLVAVLEAGPDATSSAQVSLRRQLCCSWRQLCCFWRQLCCFWKQLCCFR